MLEKKSKIIEYIGLLEMDKTFLFSDKVCKNTFLSFFAIIVLFFYIKKQIRKDCISIPIFLTSYFLTDLLSGIFHLVYLDNQLGLRENIVKFDKKKKSVVVNLTCGYASAHHLFPSGWHFISDKIIFNTSFIFFFLIILHGLKFNHNCLFFYTLIQSFIAPLTHKYAHERNHGRYVPYFFYLFQNLKIFLNPKKHKLHHEKLAKYYGFYNGYSDIILDFFFKIFCNIFKIKPRDEINEAVKEYQKTFKQDIINFELKNNTNSIRIRKML